MEIQGTTWQLQRALGVGTLLFIIIFYYHHWYYYLFWLSFYIGEIPSNSRVELREKRTRTRTRKGKMTIAHCMHLQAHFISMLIFTTVEVGVEIVSVFVRALMTRWKSKIGIVSGVISVTEWESKNQNVFSSSRLRLWLRRLRCIENQIVWVGTRNGRINQLQCSDPHALWLAQFFCFCLRLPQPSFHLIVNDNRRNQIAVFNAQDR